MTPEQAKEIVDGLHYIAALLAFISAALSFHVGWHIDKK